jgi:hypothetical protein
MSNKNQMVSLYDHLGHAAGSKLGKQVADYAKIRKAKFGTRNVENNSYRGIIYTYEPQFLEEFFTVQKFFQTPSTDYTAINTVLTEDSFKLNENI